MTRTEIAAHALQGVLASPNRDASDMHPTVVARAVVEYADALLAELERTEPAPVSPREEGPQCAIAHDEKNAPDFRTKGGFCLVCGQDWPTLVSPPAPELPPGLPPIPEGCVYWGNRPLKVRASILEEADVFGFFSNDPDSNWRSGFMGRAHAEFAHQIHYAIRRGTPIARANGIPDTP